MQDRLKFWWKVLRRGAIQLNSAAGWAGTVILLLGAAAGIVVPLAYHLPHWVTAVVLLALLVIVVAEGSYQVWHATDQARTAAATEQDKAVCEIERRFEAQRFALAIDGIDATLHPTNNPSAGGIQFGLVLANNSDEPLRYEIENIRIGTQRRWQSTDDVPPLNRSGIIPPHATAQYPAPVMHGLHQPWQMGELECTVLYGHPSGPPRYRTSRRYRIRASRTVEPRPFRAVRIDAELVGEPGVEDI